MTVTPATPCCTCGQMPDMTVSVTLKKDQWRPETRGTITSAIADSEKDLTALSHYIHENPELGYVETLAHARLVSFFKERGYDVSGYDEYPTAFRVAYTRGRGGRVFGLNSEYDALPAIGHACGHNLIAICGVGAFLAMRAAMDAHEIDGTVVLLGTPAEESHGGKIDLLKVGAYKDMGACMMLHPTKSPNGAMGGGVVRSLACQGTTATYTGKPAHAGIAPWEGVNALDAAVTAYSAISSMRQQIKPECRVQGVITDGGGPAPNVIPAKSELVYLLRAPSAADLEVVHGKMMQCLEGAATTSGCKLDTECSLMYKELRNDPSLSDEYARLMKEMHGRDIMVAVDQAMGASTDFGNVTHELPGAHPMYFIDAPPGAGNHTPEFTAAAKSKQAHDESFMAMGAMAATGLRFLGDERFAQQVQKSWEAEMAKMRDEAQR